MAISKLEVGKTYKWEEEADDHDYFVVTNVEEDTFNYTYPAWNNGEGHSSEAYYNSDSLEDFVSFETASEVKVGQKYKRTHGSYAGHVAEVTAVDVDYVHYKPGLHSTTGDWSVENFLKDWELIEEEVEPLKLEHLKVGQLVIRKSDDWPRFITEVEGDQVTHKYGRKKMEGLDSQDASDFLENFRLPDISEVAQFKEDNPDLFAEYVFGEEPVAEEDAVNHPSHYTSDPSGVECIQITRHRNFNIGNAIKYLWRAGLKKSEGRSEQEKQIEDLKKAVFYIQDEIKRLES